MMFHVRGYWIFTIAFICYDFLWWPCMYTGKLFVHVQRFIVRWHNVCFTLYIPAWLASVILETYVFVALGDYYNHNHYEPLQGLQAFHSCSSTAFDMAFHIQKESPFIPERPNGQFVCLTLSWIELFLQFFYLNVQRRAFEDQIREQQIEAVQEHER